jgi:EAL domain-containing protein (putative c-di-GMP-specific phosphodiesterase class I)
MAQTLPIHHETEFQARLSKAIAQGVLQACFKPIVDAQTRRVVSCEVAPCWHDEVFGHVQACAFVPIAQQLGLAQELELQVWSHALACLLAWRSRAPTLTLLANVSRQQSQMHDFTIYLSNDLSRLGIPRSCMDLEISEGITREDGPSALEHLTALREAGFGMVIGEFGSWHSPYSQNISTLSTGIRIDSALTRRAESKEGAVC